ncbi:MAG: hypothetical protein OIF57_19515, partial [Marinobacterium sp.]|nr:hypothetical protein [Marinobacterium sp.]
ASRDFTLTNSTVTGNQVSGPGTGASSSIGGGVFIGSGTSQINNSIVLGNTAPVSDQASTGLDFSSEDVAGSNGSVTFNSNSIIGVTDTSDPDIAARGFQASIDPSAVFQTTFARFGVASSNGQVAVLNGGPATNSGTVIAGSGPAANAVTPTSAVLPNGVNFTVTTANDDAFGGGDLASETADGGGLSLREALGLAQSASGSVTISFDLDSSTSGAQGGVIQLSDTNLSLSVTSGTITIDGDLNNDGTPDVVINGTSRFSLFSVTGASTNVTFEGLGLVGGRASQPTSVTGFGGGAVNVRDSASVTISNSILSNNSARGAGGAVYNEAGSTLNVTGSTIEHNVATDGGGVYNLGTATITNTIIRNNVASDDSTPSGGGVFSGGLSGNLTVTGSTIIGNVAFATGSASGSVVRGGGITASRDFTLTNSTVTGNQVSGPGTGASSSIGGGVFIGSGTSQINNSIV